MPQSTFALLMTGNGPEPIIIQIKDSMRKSDSLDAELANITAFERANQLTVVKRWAGTKLLELLSFPKNFTEAQALAVIARLQRVSSIEKVVAYSAFNLEFRSGDFSREYAPNQTIPDVARRGFDVDRLLRGPGAALNIASAVLAPHVTNRIIVRWKDEYVWHAAQTGFSQSIARMHTQAGCRVVDEQRVSTNMLVQVLDFDSSRSSVASMLSRYSASEWVDYVQPDYLYSSNAIPNDPGYANNGEPNLAIISAPAAWDITTGNQTLLIAVGDTGANVSHPDFAPNFSGLKFNFVSNNTDVTDNNGHGSNVTAIIGAKGNNGIFMTGVDWNVSLIIIKVLDAQGSGTSSQIASGINYAWQNRAIAINLSLGGPPSSTIDLVMQDAIRSARTNNMVVVAAAGNNGIDSNQSANLISPADTPADNVIAVGATDNSDNRASFSNYGSYRVELGAPGVNIRGLKQTTGPNDYSFFSGTSQATPHVTGAIELVRSVYPWENYTGLKDRVLMGTDDVSTLNGFFRTGGRLNLFKALHARTLLRNLSTRARVESGDSRMIGGFIVGGSGTGSLKVAIRGLGPSLGGITVAKLNNPKIQLNNSAGQPIFSNDDWGNLPQAQKNDLAAVGLNPADSREAAMVQTLAPGAYTVVVESQDGQFGVGLFEIYELAGGANEQTRLQNVSTRCKVGVGDERAIAGTIIGPNPSNPTDPTIPKRRVLMFGKGPSLALAGTLANPQLNLTSGSGAFIAANDQWRDIDGTSTGLEDKLIEAGLSPQSANESTLWPTLTQGVYTAVLSGTNSGTGIGLLEFYEY